MIEKMVIKKRTIRERTPARRGAQRTQPQVEQATGGTPQVGAGDAHPAQPSAAVRPQAN
jgi:hypothetical protein